MKIQLKSTLQEVNLLPWGSGNPQPWSDKHERIQRPFLATEGGRGKYQAEVMIVRKDKLLRS